MSLRPKTVAYRKVVFDGHGAQALDLQSLLESAVKKVQLPHLRKLDDGGTLRQLLAKTSKRSGCLCGKLVVYEKGKHIPLIDVQPDGSTWEDTAVPTDGTGTARDLEEHCLYFAIRENHVALVQSLTHRAPQLADFLAWLIEEKAGLLPSSSFALVNLPSRSAMDKLKDRKVKSVRFSEKLMCRVQSPAPAQENSGTSKGRKKKHVYHFKPSDRLFELLASFGLSGAILDDLKESPDPGKVDVVVDFRYRSRKEKKSVEALRALAVALGGSQDVDTEVHLEGKSVIKGDELSVGGTINVQCPNGCVAVDDVFTRLSEWLSTTIKGGQV